MKRKEYNNIFQPAKVKASIYAEPKIHHLEYDGDKIIENADCERNPSPNDINIYFGDNYYITLYDYEEISESVNHIIGNVVCEKTLIIIEKSVELILNDNGFSLIKTERYPIHLKKSVYFDKIKRI